MVEAFGVDLCLDRDLYATTLDTWRKKSEQISLFCCISNFSESEDGSIFDVLKMRLYATVKTSGRRGSIF